MKKSKLDIPHIKSQIVKGVASGSNQTDLSRQLGFDQSTISKFANREDIKALIEEEQAKLLEVVPDAVENVKSLVREMKNIPEKDIKRLELAYKATKDVLKSVGLFPTPIKSQTLINLTQENTQGFSANGLAMLLRADNTEPPPDVVIIHDSLSSDKE